MSDKKRLSNFEQIHTFDFNLLLIFEAIFIHGSVKKAAETLNSSGSAVSQSLNKLRTYFSDPLFLRAGQKIEPTTIAIKLHNNISKNFGDLIDSVINFSAQNTPYRIVVYASPYLALRILPDLCAYIEKTEILCDLVHISADALQNNGEETLAYRKADIVLDTQPYYSASVVAKLCMKEHVVPVCSKDHPRLDRVLTAEQQTNEPATFLNVNTEGLKRIQRDIDLNFHKRRFVFNSSSIIVNSAVSAKTNSISFIPKWFAENFSEAMGLKILESDIQIPPVNFYINYNKSAMSNENFARIITRIEEHLISKMHEEEI